MKGGGDSDEIIDNGIFVSISYSRSFSFHLCNTGHRKPHDCFFLDRQVKLPLLMDNGYDNNITFYARIAELRNIARSVYASHLNVTS